MRESRAAAREAVTSYCEVKPYAPRPLPVKKSARDTRSLPMSQTLPQEDSRDMWIIAIEEMTAGVERARVRMLVQRKVTEYVFKKTKTMYCVIYATQIKSKQ